MSSRSTTICSIEMYTPAQTCAELQVPEAVLLDMVNTGHLGAYNLGGNIRFKVTDVHAITNQLVRS